MSIHPLDEEVLLGLGHPSWCAFGPDCVDVDRLEHNAIHRAIATHWQVGDVSFTLNLVRCDAPRHLGGLHPELGRERIELTLSDTAERNAGGSGVTVHPQPVRVCDVRVLRALLKQQMALLQSEDVVGHCPRSDVDHADVAN